MIVTQFISMVTCAVSCAVQVCLFTPVLQHKVLHPVLHLHAITSLQDSGTGDNNINIGFNVPSSNPCFRDLVSWDRPNELASILLLDNEHVECESKEHH